MNKTNYLITGTDTEVGKTIAAKYLLNSYAAKNHRCIGLKPVASGATRTEQGLRNDDALQLQEAASIKLPYSTINPYCYEPAIAPHIASSNQLSVKEIYQKITTTLTLDYDTAIIEGFGGWHAPLNYQETFADLAKDLNIPVILVVGVRLGCLNHSLLTVESILNKGLQLHGWIANCIEKELPAMEDNIKTLQKMIAAPKITTIPFNPIFA